MARVTIGSTPLTSPERLPRHTRVREGFADTFGRSAEATLTAMDRDADDVPNQVPDRPLRIQRVGVVRSGIPVSIVDPFDPAGRTRLSCAIEAHTSLAANRRGIHVSRTGDLLARLADETFESLQHYAVALGHRLCDVQECDNAEVDVRGIFSYVEDVPGAKRKRSIEHLAVGASAQHVSRVVTCASRVGFSFITACPCVQQTFKHALQDRHHALLAQMLEGELPFPTHSQRCHGEVTIGGDGSAAPIPLGDLLDAIDLVVVRAQNTLPRDLELLAVQRAHATPQFVEDVLRDLLHAIYDRIKTSHPSSAITIRATSMESIHDFDLSGSISHSVAELNRAARTPTAE